MLAFYVEITVVGEKAFVQYPRKVVVCGSIIGNTYIDLVGAEFRFIARNGFVDIAIGIKAVGGVCPLFGGAPRRLGSCLETVHKGDTLSP